MLLRLGRGMAFDGCGAAAAGEGSPYLDGVLTSVCCDLDATQSESYGGSGTTWANLVASPADGAAQADYDFTSGLTFTGSAGDPAAYWLAGGAQSFTIGSNTAFLNSLGKTSAGNSWWIALAFQRVASDGTYFFATLAGTGSTNRGIRVRSLTSGSTSIFQRGPSSLTSAAVGTIPAGDNIYIVSFDKDTDTIRYWINTTTGSSSAFVMDATTDDADQTFELGTTNTNDFDSGSRIYSFAMGNEYLDDTKAAAIIAHLEARHGRDYTP